MGTCISLLLNFPYISMEESTIARSRVVNLVAINRQTSSDEIMVFLCQNIMWADTSARKSGRLALIAMFPELIVRLMFCNDICSPNAKNFQSKSLCGHREL